MLKVSKVSKDKKILADDIRAEDSKFILNKLKTDMENYHCQIRSSSDNAFTFCQDGNISLIYYDEKSKCILQTFTTGYGNKADIEYIQKQKNNKELKNLINKIAESRERSNNGKIKDHRTSIQRY